MGDTMAGPYLVLTEVAMLGDILARRAPDLVPAIDRIGDLAISADERQRIRRAVVDELCELPEGTSDRRALELEELLIHLGRS